jgi:hypothetical protein
VDVKGFKRVLGDKEGAAMSTDALREAAMTALLHFRRNAASGNWQGDDEHEAWNKLEAALADPASETTREYKHWPWCNGDRRIPAGEPGNSCCCFNDYAGRLAGAASETEKLPAKWRLESNKWAGTNMPRFLRQCADELEAALKADRERR